MIVDILRFAVEDKVNGLLFLIVCFMICGVLYRWANAFQHRTYVYSEFMDDGNSDDGGDDKILEATVLE